ncbi:MAG: 1-acyl-sn-glycerol-3-phosphate acyltransferase [Bacteroidales bacterium]|nr:1-acyl-sn-glycerol-3-phosphate acyltransferase [Bacteroidales bacterium]
MNSRIAGKILDIFGWKRIGGLMEEKYAIVLAAPHTSIWDFVIGFLYYESLGGHLKVMAKKEVFFWPLGGILRKLGCFPIDRRNPAGTIKNTIKQLEQSSDTCHIALCPEGTRKAIAKWKTGYHTMARGANAPVYLSIIDWGTKTVGIFAKVQLTENARQDTERIQKMYAEMKPQGLYKNNFRTE